MLFRSVSVKDPSIRNKVKVVQEAMKKHPNMRENFGPAMNVQNKGKGIKNRPDMANDHDYHIHFATQRGN